MASPRALSQSLPNAKNKHNIPLLTHTHAALKKVLFQTQWVHTVCHTEVCEEGLIKDNTVFNVSVTLDELQKKKSIQEFGTNIATTFLLSCADQIL